MTTKPNYKVSRTVSLPIDLLNEATQMAEERSTTLNKILEEALVEYLRMKTAVAKQESE